MCVLCMQTELLALRGTNPNNNNKIKGLVGQMGLEEHHDYMYV